MADPNGLMGLGAAPARRGRGHIGAGGRPRAPIAPARPPVPIAPARHQVPIAPARPQVPIAPARAPVPIAPARLQAPVAPVRPEAPAAVARRGRGHIGAGGRPRGRRGTFHGNIFRAGLLRGTGLPFTHTIQNNPRQRALMGFDKEGNPMEHVASGQTAMTFLGTQRGMYAHPPRLGLPPADIVGHPELIGMMGEDLFNQMQNRLNQWETAIPNIAHLNTIECRLININMHVPPGHQHHDFPFQLRTPHGLVNKIARCEIADGVRIVQFLTLGNENNAVQQGWYHRRRTLYLRSDHDPNEPVPDEVEVVRTIWRRSDQRSCIAMANVQGTNAFTTGFNFKIVDNYGLAQNSRIMNTYPANLAQAMGRLREIRNNLNNLHLNCGQFTPEEAHLRNQAIQRIEAVRTILTQTVQNMATEQQRINRVRIETPNAVHANFDYRYSIMGEPN